MTKSWSVTGNRSMALANHYIGETRVSPRKLANEIHRICTGRYLQCWMQYYFGTPDKRLRRVFGY